MSKNGTVPDAWDDDYTDIADKPEANGPTPATAPKPTKAERRAQHQELQKQIWESAENPSRNHWLEAQGLVPLRQEPKPQVTVLSRKPPTIAKRDATNRADGDDDGDDSEEEARKKREADFEERQRKAKIEREEKERRYAEARERILGPSSRETSQGRDNRRGRGRSNGNRTSRPSPQDASPAPATTSAQLYDPNDSGRRMPKPTTPTQDGPIRQPRGPDHSGRGGQGFVPRGGRPVP